MFIRSSCVAILFLIITRCIEDLEPLGQNEILRTYVEFADGSHRGMYDPATGRKRASFHITTIHLTNDDITVEAFHPDQLTHFENETILLKYERYWDKFGEGGIKRLVNEGHTFRNGRVM